MDYFNLFFTLTVIAGAAYFCVFVPWAAKRWLDRG